MLKLSKLNKMFLISGMLLAFSCLMFAGVSRAEGQTQTPEQYCAAQCQGKTDAAACKNQCLQRQKCAGMNGAEKEQCLKMADCATQTGLGKEVCVAKARCETAVKKNECLAKAECLKEKTVRDRQYCERKAECGNDATCKAKLECEQKVNTAEKQTCLAELQCKAIKDTDKQKRCYAELKCTGKSGEDKKKCLCNQGIETACEKKDEGSAAGASAGADDGCAQQHCAGKTGKELDKCKKGKQYKNCVAQQNLGSVLGNEAEYTDGKRHTDYISDNKGGTTTTEFDYGGTQVSDSTGWYAARDAKDSAQKAYQQAQTDYNNCVATKGAANCLDKRNAVEDAQQDLQTKTKEYNDAQKNASEAIRKANIAQEKAEKEAAKQEAKALKQDQKDLKNQQKAYQKAQKEYDKCIAANPSAKNLTAGAPNNPCSDQQKELQTAAHNVDVAQGKVDSHSPSNNYSGAALAYAEDQARKACQAGQENSAACQQAKAKVQDLNDQKEGKTSELKDLQSQLEASRSDGVDQDAQLQAFNKLKNYAATKQGEANAAQAKCDSYSGMTSQAAQAKAREACAEAARLQQEAQVASAAVRDEYQTSHTKANEQALAAADNNVKNVCPAACQADLLSAECKAANPSQACLKAKQQLDVLNAEKAGTDAYYQNKDKSPEERQEAIDKAAQEALDAEARATEACAADHTSDDCKKAQAAAEAAQAKVNAMRKADNEMLELADAAENYYEGPSASNQVAAARKRLSDNAVKNISQSRQIGLTGSGKNSLAGYRSQYFNYDNGGGDVLETITRRAALAVVSLKPIVYVFAGFGLIAFAWMAIFNKISWKWFGNIAMGLFLVANMGRLIEYFVVGDGSSQHYYIGQWTNGAAKNKENQLANAFKDAYWVYGDTTNQKDIGLRMWKIGADGQVQEYSREELLAGESKDGFKMSAAGFCKGTSGSGWANFKSCVGDIVSTAKKAADTVKTVKAAAEDVVARVEAVKDTVQNVAQAAKAIGQGGSITDIVSNVGVMLNNVNTAISTTTGAVGSLTNAASTISNNIQDMGKSQAQQAELAERRASGEATNQFDAMLKGQEWDSVNGGVEKVDGEWAGKGNALTALQGFTDAVASNSAALNSMAQAGVQQTGAMINAVENTSVSDIIGFGSDKTINDKRREKQEAKAREEYAASNEGINETYREQVAKTDTLYNEIHTQQNQIKQLQQQKESAQAKVNSSCSGSDDTSPMCQAAKASLSATEAALDSKEEQLADTQIRFNQAKTDLDGKYNAALNSNLDKATSDYNAANSAAEEICKENSASKECAAARNKVIETANKMASYTKEREQNTGDSRYETREESDQRRKQEEERIGQMIADNQEDKELKRQEERLKYEQEQEDIRLKNEEALARQEYNKAMDEANNLHTQIKAQEHDVEQLDRQAKQKADDAAKACSRNPDGSVCATAQVAAKAAKEAAQNKKEQLKKSEADYKKAKTQADESYKKSVTAGAAQAQRDYDRAQQQAKEAKQAMDDAKANLPAAQTAATQAKNNYAFLEDQAQKAYNAYEQARSEGKSEAEQNRLQEEYKKALKASNEARKDYERKSSAFDDLQKKQKEAETAYNNAYSQSKTAGEKLASYTNENINRTGENRLKSNEDIENQALIDQYKSDTNPNAVAQASKNSYVEHKNKTDAAKQKVQEKKAVAASAKAAYEAAEKKAAASGLEADRRIADRLKNNYLLAENEVKAAERAYAEAAGSSAQYESDYISKAISAEKYKQSEYQAQMKKATSDINKYEQAVNKQRKTVDTAGSTYMQAKSKASESNPASVKNAAILYNEYKKAKEVYDGYVKSLNQAKTQYATAQSSYQQSVAEMERLKKLQKN